MSEVAAWVALGIALLLTGAMIEAAHDIGRIEARLEYEYGKDW